MGSIHQDGERHEAGEVFELESVKYDEMILKGIQRGHLADAFTAVRKDIKDKFDNIMLWLDERAYVLARANKPPDFLAFYDANNWNYSNEEFNLKPWAMIEHVWHVWKNGFVAGVEYARDNSCQLQGGSMRREDHQDD